MTIPYFFLTVEPNLIFENLDFESKKYCKHFNIAQSNIIY